MHSSFRTGSTYLWSHLRKSNSSVAYYEIFHELLDRLRPEDAGSLAPDMWESMHPAVAPYFLEFLPLLKPGGGVAGFEPGFTYERYIPPQGCLGPISRSETDYVRALVSHAEDRGRIPVLTETRSLGRMRGLKQAVPGFHLLLYRNLFQQWCSITQQVLGGNPYFLARLVDIVRLGAHDPILDTLQRVYPLGEASVDRSATFMVFALLHLHLYVQAAGAADLVVDLNRLESDPVHRETVERALAGQAMPVNLSDIRRATAYSICPLGRTQDLQERLKILGDMIIDRSPDIAGRDLGSLVLSDLLEEYDRHEFYTSRMRKTLLQVQKTIAAGEDLPRQIALLSDEHSVLRQQVDETRRANELLASIGDAHRVEVQQIRQQLDEALDACNVLASERDEALREQGRAHLERETAMAAKDQLLLERDDLIASHRLERNEQEAVEARYEAHAARLEVELADQQAVISGLREQAQAEQGRLQAECDQARAAARRASCERDEQKAFNRKLSVDQAASFADRERQRDRVGCLATRIGQLEQEIDLLAVGLIATCRSQDATTVPTLSASMTRRGVMGRMRNWRRLGDLARDARDWPRAAVAYRNYLELQPENAAIWVQYGHALKEAGILAAALAAYVESRRLQPVDGDRDLHLLDLQRRLTIDGLDARPIASRPDLPAPGSLLLVTTTVAAWVLETGSGQARRIHEGSGVYYGVSFSEDTLFIACRQAVVGAEREMQDNVILCFDRNLVQRQVLRAPWPIRDVHQIFCHDATLYVCATYDDAVLTYDLVERSWHRWHPFGQSNGLPDQHHINSILVDEVGILLAGNAPHGWIASFGPDRILRGGSHKPLGTGTHNVWHEHGRTTVCSSDEGGIRSEDGGFETICADGWLRGVASAGGERYVGISQNRTREAREGSSCTVLRIDESGSIIRRYTFDGYGMVHDMRLLGVADPTHNGIEFLLAEGALDHAGSVYQTSPDLIDLGSRRGP